MLDEVTGCDECGISEDPDAGVLHNGRLLCVHCALSCPEDCSHITLEEVC